MSLQTLAYEEVRVFADRPYNATAFFIPGVLGCAGYWRPFARQLASAFSDFTSASDMRLVPVDLRNHGRSSEIEDLDPPHDMVNTARDLADLVKAKGWAWPEVIVGHSMGAKVVLQYAQSCARGDYGESAVPPKQVWILDSDPGKLSPESGGVEILLKFLQNLPSSIPSREWLVNHMNELGFPAHVSKWIGSTLLKPGDQTTWMFKLEGAVQMFYSSRELSYWSLLENPPKGMEIAIVRAENNANWNPDAIARLESLASHEENASTGKVSLHVLPKSDHWVHIDNPKGLIDILAPKFASL